MFRRSSGGRSRRPVLEVWLFISGYLSDFDGKNGVLLLSPLPSYLEFVSACWGWAVCFRCRLGCSPFRRKMINIDCTAIQ